MNILEKNLVSENKVNSEAGDPMEAYFVDRFTDPFSNDIYKRVYSCWFNKTIGYSSYRSFSNRMSD